jgi:hypothetical protein
VAATDVSFDFYEGIRIVLPGGLAAVLTEAVLRTFETPEKLTVSSSLVTALSFGLGAGLLLYFVDVPTKSTAYRVNQPSDVLRGWVEKDDERRLVQFYFMLFDTEVPPEIRARALYMGSIFRIGFEAILLLALFPFGVWSASGFFREQQIRTHGPLVGVSCCMLILVLVCRGFATVLRESKGHVTVHSVGRLKNIIRQDLGRVRAWVFNLGVVVLVVGIPGFAYRLWVPDWLLVGAAGLLALVWLSIHWISPFRKTPGGRGPDAFTSLLLFAVPTMALIVLSYLRGFPGIVNPEAVYGWVAAPITAAILIAVRGHERRLGGAYASQRTWLETNKKHVMTRFGEAFPSKEEPQD